MKSLELLGNRLSVMLKQGHIEAAGEAVNTPWYYAHAGTWVCQHAICVKHSLHSL